VKRVGEEGRKRHRAESLRYWLYGRPCVLCSNIVCVTIHIALAYSDGAIVFSNVCLWVCLSTPKFFNRLRCRHEIFI